MGFYAGADDDSAVARAPAEEDLKVLSSLLAEGKRHHEIRFEEPGGDGSGSRGEGLHVDFARIDEFGQRHVRREARATRVLHDLLEELGSIAAPGAQPGKQATDLGSQQLIELGFVGVSHGKDEPERDAFGLVMATAGGEPDDIASMRCAGGGRRKCWGIFVGDWGGGLRFVGRRSPTAPRSNDQACDNPSAADEGCGMQRTRNGDRASGHPRVL